MKDWLLHPTERHIPILLHSLQTLLDCFIFLYFIPYLLLSQEKASFSCFACLYYTTCCKLFYYFFKIDENMTKVMLKEIPLKKHIITITCLCKEKSKKATYIPASTYYLFHIIPSLHQRYYIFKCQLWIINNCVLA